MVVEDIPSAVRAARYLNAVSLNGTECGDTDAIEIAQTCRDVIWALDNDALSNAVRLLQKHRLLFKTSRVLPLKKDIKDMDEESLDALLRER